MMDNLTKLLLEFYIDAYLQGREDGLEGLHIEPQVVFSNYLANEDIAKKLSQLAVAPPPTYN
jgi:hypothetical protein